MSLFFNLQKCLYRKSIKSTLESLSYTKTVDFPYADKKNLNQCSYLKILEPSFIPLLKSINSLCYPLPKKKQDYYSILKALLLVENSNNLKESFNMKKKSFYIILKCNKFKKIKIDTLDKNSNKKNNKFKNIFIYIFKNIFYISCFQTSYLTFFYSYLKKNNLTPLGGKFAIFSQNVTNSTQINNIIQFRIFYIKSIIQAKLFVYMYNVNYISQEKEIILPPPSGCPGRELQYQLKIQSKNPYKLLPRRDHFILNNEQVPCYYFCNQLSTAGHLQGVAENLFYKFFHGLKKSKENIFTNILQKQINVKKINLEKSKYIYQILKSYVNMAPYFSDWESCRTYNLTGKGAILNQTNGISNMKVLSFFYLNNMTYSINFNKLLCKILRNM